MKTQVLESDSMTSQPSAAAPAAQVGGGVTRVLRAKDGYQLAASVFEPGPPLEGVVVINAALGVKRAFYAPFAQYLAECGLRVITYDYRGVGESRHGALRELRATLQDWAQLDISAALELARSLAADKPIFVVGHSLGAQLLGLAEHLESVAGVVSVSAGTGTWWRVEGRSRWLGAALMYAIIPLTTSVLGYVPAKRLGLGDDLPAGVGLEWAAWCRHREYFAGYLEASRLSRFERLKAPWLALGFSDDGIANRGATAELLRRYPAARVSERWTDPAAVGCKQIGHLGYFSRRGRAQLWPLSSDFLLRTAAASVAE